MLMLMGARLTPGAAPGGSLPTGLWDNPYVFGTGATKKYQWYDTGTGLFRTKTGASAPASMTDGDFLTEATP